jgi:ankyrin repeat protein
VFKSAFRLASRGKLAELQREVMMHPTLLNQRSGDGATLLWAAARRGQLTLVEWLVGRGADIHTPGSDVHVLSVMVSPYCAAVAHGNAAVAEFLHEHGARADVFTAAYLGDVDLLACLVQSEPDLLDQPSSEDDFYPVTPLHFAVDGCQVGAATYLVARGAKVRPHSRRLLTLAARHGSSEIVRLLLEGGADAREAENLGPLRAGDDTIARMLVGAGLDINARVRNRETFLTLACRGDKGGSIDAVRILLALGADIHATNAAGRTALEAAERGRLTDIVSLLVRHGARR